MNSYIHKSQFTNVVTLHTKRHIPILSFYNTVGQNCMQRHNSSKSFSSVLLETLAGMCNQKLKNHSKVYTRKKNDIPFTKRSR